MPKREKPKRSFTSGSSPTRDRETLIPEFDPEELAKELETEIVSSDRRPTLTPPFDPAAYARIVDQKIDAATDARDTPRTMTASNAVVLTEDDDLETIGREMYGSYLESNFPEALVLAERVLEKEPTHSLAQLVAERCRNVMSSSRPPSLHPSSVVKLRIPTRPDLELDKTSMFVLGHVDGVANAATVAELAGVPPEVAMDRLHALLDLGFVEVVSA